MTECELHAILHQLGSAQNKKMDFWDVMVHAAADAILVVGGVMADVTPVQWPGQPVNAGKSDISAPLTELLERLNLLKKKPKGDDESKPRSWGSSAIQSDVMAISKLVGIIITSVGGLTAAGGIATAAWSGADEQIRLALLSGTALVLAAALLGLALVVRSDVGARGRVAAAQSQARASIGRSFIDSGAALVSAPHYLVGRKGTGWLAVSHFGYGPNGLFVATTTGLELLQTEIEALVAWPLPTTAPQT
jgi:hypothetical protein